MEITKNFVVIGGGAEGSEEAKEVAAECERVMGEAFAGLNENEKKVAQNLFTLRRTINVLAADDHMPEMLRVVLLGCAITLAKMIPDTVADRKKVIAAIKQADGEVEAVIKRVHAKHCPDCGNGGKHGSMGAAADALKKTWN